MFSKIECKNDSPPRILKLPRTPEVSKDWHERENRKKPSPSASPESQMLDKPARVAHKPKSFIKLASPSGYSPGSHTCPHTAMVSPSHGNVDFGEKVSARQQVFSDWGSSFVPTPTPRTHRRSGCPPEEVEGQQASPRSSSETRIIQPILKRVDAPPKPKRNISFPLNPRNVHYFKPCEYENYAMFNRSYTDPEDAQCSEDAPVNCQNTEEQSPIMEEKLRDIGELKPGPSVFCEKSFKRKWQMQDPAVILMKSICQAKHWTKSLHREPPKDSRHSAKITGVGYKWSEKQKKRPNEIEGSSLNASPLHGHHPGSSQNASHGHHPGSSQNASHGHHPGSSQNSSPRHGHCPRSSQNASHGHHPGSSQNASHGHHPGSSQNASHGHHPGSSQNSSPRHGHHPGSSQNSSPRHGHCPRSSQNASHGHHPGSSQNASHGHHPGSSQNASHGHHPGSSQNASHGHHPGSSQNVSPRHGHHPGSSQNSSPRHGHCPRSSQNVSPLVVTIHPPARGEELSQQPGTIALPWMNGTSGGRET
ncbi:hornerin-like isoform X5 [Oncorhynchus keta]|uniref:hornerin-like isoform X5 n=1 Tax=Oncorhynchus keta TaxID=8018 RepID=UPI00227A14D6|nr:hornerin-like isoform X5 [Oncorhynchus keta]